MADVNMDGFSDYSMFNLRGEDAASLLTSQLTFIFLLVTAGFLSAVQLVGEPIECWCPAQMSDAMCNYTKSICWISKQYVIDMDEPIPGDAGLKDATQDRAMQFYPMVPFILIALAMALKLPNFLWTAFQGEEGLNVSKAVQLATSQDLHDEQTQENVAFEMNFNLVSKGNNGQNNTGWLSVKKIVTACALFPLGGDLGTYQTGLFLFTRLLAVVINILVYPLLGLALQMDYTLWGWDLFKGVIMEGRDPDLVAFPRETLCDFRVRQLQNVHDYTVQCVLPINMFSEKVFLLLWFWLLVLLAANLYSYQYWFRKMLLPHYRRTLVSKHLTILFPDIKATRRKQIADFAWNYLSYDSVLVLRILEMAAGSRFANVVVRHLWKEYDRRHHTHASRNGDFPEENVLVGPD